MNQRKDNNGLLSHQVGSTPGFGASLTKRRTRRCVYGHAKTEHAAGYAHHFKGQRIGPQAGLLLSIVDDGGIVCTDGEGSGPGRAL